jgi:hypothetical protein
MREGADPAILTAAAKRYHDDPLVVRGFGKHPATWLNAKCWLDEPTPEPEAGTLSGVVVDRRQQATNDRFARAMERARDREGRT